METQILRLPQEVLSRINKATKKLRREAIAMIRELWDKHFRQKIPLDIEQLTINLVVQLNLKCYKKGETSITFAEKVENVIDIILICTNHFNPNDPPIPPSNECCFLILVLFINNDVIVIDNFELRSFVEKKYNNYALFLLEQRSYEVIRCDHIDIADSSGIARQSDFLIDGNRRLGDFVVNRDLLTSLFSKVHQDDDRCDGRCPNLLEQR